MSRKLITLKRIFLFRGIWLNITIFHQAVKVLKSNHSGFAKIFIVRAKEVQSRIRSISSTQTLRFSFLASPGEYNWKILTEYICLNRSRFPNRTCRFLTYPLLWPMQMSLYFTGAFSQTTEVSTGFLKTLRPL